ncbi:MAG TPA: hemerythrin domain-containing protein, partial [Ginsengibacter sp.]|nr:hemerythrin domain-containing protein [Ginsengibacter sp.]
VLFPYIKELVTAKNTAQPLHAAHFGTVQNPINMMEHEHEIVGNKLDHIRTLSKNYSLPEDACASYSYLFKTLDEFENDLHIHVHLENNILFPKTLEIEKQLQK